MANATKWFWGLCFVIGWSAFGGDLAERLRAVATTNVVAALRHERNRDILTETEREGIIRLIEVGLPFSLVLPENVKVGDFVDLTGTEAKVATDKKGRPRLLDNEENPVDARVVSEKAKRRFVIQWDERSLPDSLKGNAAVPDSLVLMVAHEAIRFAYHVGEIERNDDERKFSARLFVPAAADALSLPSAAYRTDYYRRLKEMIPRYEELIRWLETDLATHRMAKAVLAGYRDDLANVRGITRDKLANKTEEFARHLDDVERSLIQQRETLLEQINIGHVPIDRPQDLGRYDFDRRAKVILQYCERVDSMITWHDKLRYSSDAQDYLAKYQRLGVDWFVQFDRRKWKFSDEDLADRFDGYERTLGSYLERYRREYPPRR